MSRRFFRECGAYVARWAFFLPDMRYNRCFLLTGACQTRNSGFGMRESDSAHTRVASVQAYDSRRTVHGPQPRSGDETRSVSHRRRRCKTGLGTENMAVRPMTYSIDVLRVSGQVRAWCVGCGAPHVGCVARSSYSGRSFAPEQTGGTDLLAGATKLVCEQERAALADIPWIRPRQSVGGTSLNNATTRSFLR
jgi:hypothetical protein